MGKQRKPTPRILIAGLGNLLLKDDGIGVHVVRAIMKDPPKEAKVAEVGTAVLDALHLFEWADTVIGIDAMQAGGPPGTVYAFGVGDVAESKIKASLHEVNLVAALRFLPEASRPEVTMIGVEPEIIDFGLELSPSVVATLPNTVQAVRKMVERSLATQSHICIEGRSQPGP